MKQQEATKRFYDFVWPQRAAVLRVAQILTGDVHEAEDLAQETLVKAFKAIHQFQPGTDARGWLVRILRNARIDRIRAAGDGKDVSLDALAEDVADNDSDQAAGESDLQNPRALLDQFSDEAVIDALQQLPEEMRWTLLLVDVEGIKQEEAAGVMSVPLGTVKSRTHRGRAMVKVALMSLARERRLIRDAG